MATGTGASRRGWQGSFPGTAQSGRLRGSSGNPGCAASVQGDTRLPRWAGAGGSVPQDDPRPHQAELSVWWVTVAAPQPERPQPGNRVSEGRDLFKEHLVLFREGFSSFFSSSELSATDVFSSSSFSSLFISLVPEETLLRPSPPDKPAEEAEPHMEVGGARPTRRTGGSPGPAPGVLCSQRAASRTHPALLVCSKRSRRGAGSALPPFPILLPPPPRPSGIRSQPPPAEQGPGALCTHSWQEGQEHVGQTSGKGSK